MKFIPTEKQMHKEEYPIGGPLTREYFCAMLSKTEDIPPVSNIKEVRTSHKVAHLFANFDMETAGIGPVDWPLVEGHHIIFDMEHFPQKSITLIREDGLRVSFPVE